MAYELLITPAAHEDLESSLDYIVHNLANPVAAVKLLDQVEVCYEQLREFPFLYESCHDVQLKMKGYHKVTIGNFVLVYHPTKEKQQVYILRFFYGGRDYEKLI